MQQPHLFPHELGHHPNPHGYTHGKLFHLRATASVHGQPHQTTRISSQVSLPPLRAVFVKLLTLGQPSHSREALSHLLPLHGNLEQHQQKLGQLHTHPGRQVQLQTGIQAAGVGLGRHLGSLGRQQHIQAGPGNKKIIQGSRSGIPDSRKKLGQEALIWIFLQKLSLWIF